MMTQHDDNPVERMLGDIYQDQVPEDVDRQLHSQLANFRLRLGSAEHAPWHRSFTQRRLFLWGGALAGTISFLMVGVSIWVLRPQMSFADVVAAVREHPWIHVTITEGDGVKREVWYSQEKDISAWRDVNWMEYHDHRLRVYESYDVREKTLYRVPEYTPRRMDTYRMIAAALPILLENEEPMDEPLDKMDFLGKRRSEMTVSDQSLESTHEDGREWLDYRVEIRHPELPEPMRLLFRVDPTTKLPQLCRFEGHMSIQMDFDYPEKGPSNVYDLGVPETANLINRIPSDDIKRILKTLRVGRARMDNYRAILVERLTPSDYQWWNEPPMILYRKDDKYRIDNARWRGDLPMVDEPADDADMDSWWKLRAEEFIYTPFYIVRGSTVYRISIPGRIDATGATLLEVESVKSTDTNTKPGDILPPYYSRRPEFVCRPPLGIGSQQMEPILDLHPVNGPPDCVLLHVKRTGRMPGASGTVPEHVTIPDAYRFWLNPSRGYVAERWDMLGGGEAGNEEIVTSYVIDEMAKSPDGLWYATKFRHVAKGPHGKTIEQLFHIYVDFDVDLPDSLFDPPAVGHKY